MVLTNADLQVKVDQLTIEMTNLENDIENVGYGCIVPAIFYILLFKVIETFEALCVIFSV
jgi:hypothetical protein